MYPAYGPSVTPVATPTTTAGYTRYTNQQPAYGVTNQQQPYDERHTAYANVVSPVALVYQGHVSPEALASLQQYQDPFTTQNQGRTAYSHISNHAAHAVENQNAMQLGHKF